MSFWSKKTVSLIRCSALIELANFFQNQASFDKSAENKQPVPLSDNVLLMLDLDKSGFIGEHCSILILLGHPEKGFSLTFCKR